MDGVLVESTDRADAMADFFEKVQWKVRPATLTDEPPLGDQLPVDEAPFSTQEVGMTISALKWEKASGPDDIPAEYWKSIAQTPGGLQWLTNLCNACWETGAIPENWKESKISAIYKNKGVATMTGR